MCVQRSCCFPSVDYVSVLLFLALAFLRSAVALNRLCVELVRREKKCYYYNILPQNESKVFVKFL